LVGYLKRGALGGGGVTNLTKGSTYSGADHSVKGRSRDEKGKKKGREWGRNNSALGGTLELEERRGKDRDLIENPW